MEERREAEEARPYFWFDLVADAAGTVLEVAAAVAPAHAPHKPALPALVLVNGDVDFRASDERTRETHARTGLVAECRASHRRIELVELALVNLLLRSAGDRPPVLAGWNVEIAAEVLKRGMPRLWGRLAPRRYDVRAVVAFCETSGMRHRLGRRAERAHPGLLEAVTAAQLCEDWARGGRS